MCYSELYFSFQLFNLPDNSLARDILSVQIECDYPGLAKECTEQINQLNLPDISKIAIAKSKWKRLVKEALQKKNSVA